MRDSGERRITLDIDTVAAIVGAIAGLELTIWLAMTTTNRLYPIFALFSFFACVTYLISKRLLRSTSAAELIAEPRRTPSTYLMLNAVFFVLMFCALAAVLLRPELYSRPVGYFVCTALASGVLAAEIILLPPGKSYSYFVLAKIILLALSLIWTIQVIFPSLLGMDPFAHQQITEAIISNRYIPTGEPYSSFPVMHLTSGTTMLVTGLHYKMATMLSVCLIYVIVGLSFVFLLGRFIHSSKVGLMAALLLACTALYVQWGWWMVPNAYAVIFLPAIAFLLFKAKDKHPLLLLTLSMVLMGVLILAHAIAALCMAIVLFLSWLGYQAYRKTYQTEFKIPVTLTVSVLFGVAMFAWWMYCPTPERTITFLRDRITTGFRLEPSLKTAKASAQYLLTVPFSENLLRNVTNPLVWAISFVGCLAAFSKRFGNSHSFVLAIGGLVLLAIGFISLPLDLWVIPSRWQLASMVLLAIPAGFGLIFVFGMLKKSFKIVLLLSLLVAVLTFISITDPLSNIDNPMWAKNTTVRYAFEESEVQAATTISNVWGDEVATDEYYYDAGYSSLGILPLTDNLTTRDFSGRKEIIVIRKEIVERPFYLPGIYRLTYDPREILREQGFSQVYDCGTVGAFLPKTE